MRIKKLSIIYFQNGRIIRPKIEDRKTVLYWIKRLTNKENVPPIEVTYLTGADKLSLIDGSARLKACEVTNQKFIFVKFISRSELTKNIFKREFKQDDSVIKNHINIVKTINKVMDKNHGSKSHHH